MNRFIFCLLLLASSSVYAVQKEPVSYWHYAGISHISVSGGGESADGFGLELNYLFNDLLYTDLSVYSYSSTYFDYTRSVAGIGFKFALAERIDAFGHLRFATLNASNRYYSGSNDYIETGFGIVGDLSDAINFKVAFIQSSSTDSNNNYSENGVAAGIHFMFSYPYSVGLEYEGYDKEDATMVTLRRHF